MAHSRFSIPFFAVFLVVIAAYMAYLATTKNIFQVASFNHSSSTSLIATNEGSETEFATEESHQSFFNVKKLKKIFVPNSKKIIMSPEKDAELKAKESATPNTLGDTQNTNGSTTAAVNTKAVVVETSKTLSPQQAREYEIKLLWEKYSASLPKLYSRPFTPNITEEKLARIGQLSASLDLLYQEDKGLWALKLEEVRPELIALAAEGEREGARALSFQYVRRPLNKMVESLTWALIANAIASNDYYLYICAEEFTCTENLFSQASEQAKYYSDMYNFIEKK